MPPAGAGPDEILTRFVTYATGSGLTLYPAQEEALLELMAGKHVVLNTPTGSGKSLVAAALHFKGLAEGKTSVYTSPVKALVSEKFFDLCRLFGPEQVGMLTGDASINRNAPIVCCTAEILSNMALRDAATADYVVMDEFHYYGDRERGMAWQVPLLCMPRTTFLLMSATLGDVTTVAEGLVDLTGREVATVRGRERPVPLDFEYRET
ncbi:MAG TPA: DEAD/DEAH box helicase, partial [Polyangia bacterium]|nr:DEAD/DEAH box helicase [Polyangia bacterium]